MRDFFGVSVCKGFSDAMRKEVWFSFRGSHPKTPLECTLAGFFSVFAQQLHHQLVTNRCWVGQFGYPTRYSESLLKHEIALQTRVIGLSEPFSAWTARHHALYALWRRSSGSLNFGLVMFPNLLPNIVREVWLRVRITAINMNRKQEAN